jgi:hypothetical protein
MQIFVFPTKATLACSTFKALEKNSLPKFDCFQLFALTREKDSL